MDVFLLLDSLKKAGIQLSRDGEQLKVKATRGIVTPELLDRIRQCKEELLNLYGQEEKVKEAIAKALALRPDLILMDVIMPKMNGFDAIRELRRSPETRSIPILIVTTKGEEESMETGYLSGCSDYITKPIDSLELLTKIRSFLGK
jgi:CheY-like chemotaxis protein